MNETSSGMFPPAVARSDRAHQGRLPMAHAGSGETPEGLGTGKAIEAATLFSSESPVHGFFGLSYASYLCVPRSVLQAMPLEWQAQLVALLERLPETPDYTVLRRTARGAFMRDELADYRHGKAGLRLVEANPS